MKHRLALLLLSLATISFAAPSFAQIPSDQIGVIAEAATPTDAMSAANDASFPLACLPLGVKGSYYPYGNWASYVVVGQLATSEGASCSVEMNGQAEPGMWNGGGVGCHIGQNGWSVTSRATRAEVAIFRATLTVLEQRTFGWFRAAGAQSNEQFRYVIVWQPQFEYCITGPI